LFIIEGDEYDTAWFDKRPKFLLYRPFHAILTSIEFDHSDIYANIGEIEAVFRRFVGLLPEAGSLVCYGDEKIVREASKSARSKVITYGCTESCDWQLQDITPTRTTGAVGQVRSPNGNKMELRLQVSGTHNLLNGLAVLAHAVEAGQDATTVLQTLSTFQGVARRLQKIAEGGGITLYDDFAHHPTAIKKTFTAVRRSHPSARIWALFEPRSNTMVRNFFQKELEESLSIADRIVLGPLHRREKIPAENRLDVDLLLANLNRRGLSATSLDSLYGAAGKVMDSLEPGDVVVIMSNGAFGGLTGELAANIIARGIK
jgi:UDP-N-acetylmuramate: L-alanyl-gamma-D-glutamyl-meso-diaminopimelate ligase